MIKRKKPYYGISKNETVSDILYYETYDPELNAYIYTDKEKNKHELVFNPYGVYLERNCNHNVGCYVSVLGSANRTLERVKYFDDNGYVKVELPGCDGFDYLHKLIAFTFGDKNGETHREAMKTGKIEIDHIDGDKKNNSPENLQYVPREVNLYRAWKNSYPRSERRLKAFLMDAIENCNLESVINNLYSEINKKKYN